jgi:hypothetical protein
MVKIVIEEGIIKNTLITLHLHIMPTLKLSILLLIPLIFKKINKVIL